MSLTRRALLELIAASTFYLTAGPLRAAEADSAPALPRLSFPQGVASGDPRPEAVMLWTRAVPAGPPGPVALLLEVSEDPDFQQLLLREKLHADPASDYTVRAYVDELQPDRTYYYRFRGGERSVSRSGRTRTAPASGQSPRVNLAFASCQNYEQAYYGAWARMIADDQEAAENERIHFVLHLGDFIYERLWDQQPGGDPQPRRLPDFPDGVSSEKNRRAVTLADYRHLYKRVLEDPHLQAARARWPFVCVWDDHEFSNNAHQSYSTYGAEPVLEAQRKLDANQAWFEFIPTVLDELEQQPSHGFQPAQLEGDDAARNTAARDSLSIYRKLSWGSLLDIVLTDTRSYRSPHCLPKGFAESLGLPMTPVSLVELADAGSRYQQGNPPEVLPYGEGGILNPAQQRPPGTLLGKAQRDWFLETLAGSGARWKLWGNSLPLLPLRLDLGSLPFTDYQDSVFTIDPWAGYPYEQALLMETLRQRGVSGVVSFSGDHHMHAAGTVTPRASDPEGRPVAVDFAVTGISSTPMFEEVEAVARGRHSAFQPLVYRQEGDAVLPVWNATLLRGALAAYAFAQTGVRTLLDWMGPNPANPGLRYVDAEANGYGLASFDAQQLEVQLVTMSDCKVPFSEPPPVRHRAVFSLPHWRAGEDPDLRGPRFEVGAPFPFQSAAT
jgi:alkaline phosphatase D